MVMKKEDHESLLNELLDPELETSRRTEILQLLRNDYNTVIAEHEEMTANIEKLQKDNSDLVLSNSKLFRQIGIMGNTEKEEELEQKEFSETITIEELEKGVE